jgi:hypothetical protein
MQAQGAPAALPVGETGGANGGAASRGTGCRASSPATWPVLPSPKLGGSRSEVRQGRSPKPRPRVSAAQRRRLQGACAPSGGAWREAPSSGRRRCRRPQGRTRRSRGTRRDRARPPAAHRLGNLREQPAGRARPTHTRPRARWIQAGAATVNSVRAKTLSASSVAKGSAPTSMLAIVSRSSAPTTLMR